MVLTRLRYARRLAAFWMLLPLAVLALPLWSWPVPDWTALTLTLLLFTVTFVVGFVLAETALRPHAAELDRRARAAPARDRWLPWMLVGVIAMNAITLVARAAYFNPLECSNVLACTNDAYQGYIKGSSMGASAPVEYIRIVFSPFIYAALGLSVWRLVGRGGSYRRLCIVVVLSEMAIAFATGTSRNIANLLLFAAFCRLLQAGLAVVRVRARDQVAGAVALAVGAGAFFLYFASTQLARDGAVALVGLHPFRGGYIEALSYTTGSTSFALKGLESVARYLSSGYFGLSLGLDMDMGETFPFGHSTFFARNASVILGDDTFLTRSLPAQIEWFYGWDRIMSWHSVYTWLMSDFGYAGTAFIMAVFGAIAAFAFAVAIAFHDNLSKLPALLMFLFVLYVPANNQLAQAPETAVAFLAMLPLLAARALTILRAPTRRTVTA